MTPLRPGNGLETVVTAGPRGPVAMPSDNPTPEDPPPATFHASFRPTKEKEEVQRHEENKKGVQLALRGFSGTVLHNIATV